MKQSTLHVGIIMDGNGRWAAVRGGSRSLGHQYGVETVERVVKAAPELGIRTLTLYAFSSDNWRRPPEEIDVIMSLLQAYLRREIPRCREEGVRFQAIGRRDRLGPSIQALITEAEQATAHCGNLHLRLALDYSSRDAILEAARACAQIQEWSRTAFSKALGAPEVDLVIRTGGEQRLSDFLLWECAYAELYFTPIMWPDFTKAHLAAALRSFDQRDRRFGGLKAIQLQTTA